ncbi:MAG: ribosomal protein S18-alanine N-acetyltransferase [Acidobacteriota bacterium]|nr:ribosomal protein S18-alanine N-acetyltransferase [Acidobacteriota bacterium]
MQPELIPAVISLEQDCGLSSREAASYSNLLQGSNSVLLVALNDSSAIVAVFSGWVVADEFEIDNIAVSPAFRQQGIAAKLLAQAIEVAGNKGAIRAILEVRASNQPACALYEKFGFAVVGRRKSYYREPKEDALIMAIELR